MDLYEYIASLLIKLSDRYTEAPHIISIGESPVGTLGNFSVSIGKAKARKTFNTSAIAAAALTDHTVLRYSVSLPMGRKKVLYVDTEQSRYHCHRVLVRIYTWAELSTDVEDARITYISLRACTPEERLTTIAQLLESDNQYSLVIIDGLRDLMHDINNPTEAGNVANTLLQWTGKHNLHIHGVLHMNKGDNNARGHIGTELCNKAETVITVAKSEKDPLISIVKPMYVREKDFNSFAFTITDNGLPVLVDGHVEQAERNTKDGNEGTKKERKDSLQDFPYSFGQHEEALGFVFKDGPVTGYENLQGTLKKAYARYGSGGGMNAMSDLLAILKTHGVVVRKNGQYHYEKSMLEQLYFNKGAYRES